MRVRITLFALLLAASLLGCGRQHDPPEHLVVLIDISGSIQASAEEQAFTAIGDLAGHLHRGDRITIIPILSDAQAQASGRILRFEVPTVRQAYDNDLKKFRVNIKASLEQLKSAAIAHPGAKTDILGSIGLAEQEFKSESSSSRRVLAILSDFIQEDGEVDFSRDKRLGSMATAKGLAMQMARTGSQHFRGTPVYLGQLQSNEYTRIRKNRREAIQEFWIEYFRSSGTQSMFVTDGPGLLTAFKAIAILRNEKLQSIPTASCHPRLVTEVHPRSRKTKPALAYGLELRPQYISLTERQSLLSCNKDY